MQEQKSMVSERKLAHAVGGKSVRACDNCVKKRARWYCAADDAFLCDSCDSSVHSANPLARRHERVRLKISSSKGKEEVNTSSFPFDDEVRVDVPSWQKGFTRKARTPRQKKSNFPTHIVPEQEACSEDESEEQLLYRVPVFDAEKNYGENGNFTQDQVNDFLPSELDLAEFAADVESLLGKGLEDEAFDMEGLGIFDCGSGDIDHRDEGKDFCLRNNTSIKDEEYYEENLLQFDGLGRETFELNFDCGVSPSPIMRECEEEQEEEEKKAQVQEINKALLKLDYDRVMSAWDYRKSPWMTGQRPDFNSGDWWPDYYSLKYLRNLINRRYVKEKSSSMNVQANRASQDFQGTSGIMHAYKGDVAMPSVQAAAAGGGREARVSRYREKRRTRLFSKKIRYEVRKLNAEKRPRMKGRFVKRASFAATAFP